MCGIAGLFHPFRPEPPAAALLRGMTDAQRHRGPDGEGFHAERHLGFGHRRLAIVDLAGGTQPMATADGAVVVTFNGEIYNHEQLRLELQRLGHVFRSRSDTEVLLHGWRAWGADMPARLVGMFAFALWDREAGRLFLARDPLGEKPLHYAVMPDGGFAFASEIGGLTALPNLPRGLDPVALDDFLALGYVPEPATIEAAIRRLPPAHALMLRLGEPVEAAMPRRYWSPPRMAGQGAADAAESLRARIDAAVRARMMSDVPLGAFLSGGIDSGVVTSLAAEATDHPLATFTIGFAGAADERPDAALVAARYGTRHTSEDGAAADYLAMAREIPRIFGEPFGDTSAVPTLAVSALARRHVTVALSGDGGDEVFAGYRRYRFHMMAEAARRLIPAGLRRGAFGALARAYPKLDRAPRWLRAKATLTELSLDSAMGYYSTVCRIAEARRRALLSPTLRATVAGHDPSDRFVQLMDECDTEDPLLQAQYADLQTYLPGDILAKVDRTSMAVSLEVRPPLLDPALVAWGMALPSAMKLRNGQGKHILREVAAALLPSELLARPKRGFATGLAGHFRARADVIRDRLLGGALADSGMFDLRTLGALVDQHAAKATDHSQALWHLLILEGFFAQRAGAVEPAPKVSAVA
ncbi:asparagine synthase (glutamine-hydrolyzing) [Roseomonas sp. HJA6]|uniref:asparagine synthase (glutamine-hydrolyzing) n=1 Tax=Roseomonas alba TaxID=2846776 RepID=A0ABS7A5G7_9PROT|nr:asparagine synthase (glutamine-hydrolyzing) [Neoroseomonas alba]MBW6397539.1 asparagine synthase (glutamine-hydrolyzing) [Neoroseomonas alba]